MPSAHTFCLSYHQASPNSFTRVQYTPRGILRVLKFSLIPVKMVHVTELCQVVLCSCKVQMEKLLHAGKLDQRLTCWLLQLACSQCQSHIHKVMICATNSQVAGHHASNSICIFMWISNLLQRRHNHWKVFHLWVKLFLPNSADQKFKIWRKISTNLFSMKNRRSCFWLAGHNQTLTIVQNKRIDKENFDFLDCIWIQKRQSRMCQCNAI